jgi:hypothetical protein
MKNTIHLRRFTVLRLILQTSRSFAAHLSAQCSEKMEQETPGHRAHSSTTTIWPLHEPCLFGKQARCTTGRGSARQNTCPLTCISQPSHTAGNESKPDSEHDTGSVRQNTCPLTCISQPPHTGRNKSKPRQKNERRTHHRQLSEHRTRNAICTKANTGSVRNTGGYR